MDADRLNSPSTSAVTLEAFGYCLHLSQDPNSKHLGTTVWDASMVLVKFLEKNSRRGKFCPSKLKGKRAIELGAGCGGLAGFGMALLGCEVVSTDQVEVLPLLMKNVERNTSRIMQSNPDSAFGSIEVAELDWGNKDHIKAVGPPFDYIIGTDIVYVEHLLEPLLQTMLALSGPRTTILLGHEIRSTTVHEQMISMWKNNFQVKTVPKAKLDSKYQHPSIQLYILEQKDQLRWKERMPDGHQVVESNQGNSMDDDDSSVEESKDSEEMVVNRKHVEVENGKMDEWQIRRCGAMAARLLRDVKLM